MAWTESAAGAPS
jgi:hypothetical protein